MSTPPLFSGRAPDILQQQVEVKLVHGRRVKLIPLAKFLGRLILRIRHHGTAPDEFGRLIGQEEYVLQEAATESFASLR
jgi:hypothetical protein